MSNAVPLIVIGGDALLGGVLIVIFRRRIRDLTVDEEKTLFGQKVGETAGKLQSPFWVGVAGAGGAVLGVIMIVAGATFLLSSQAGSQVRSEEAALTGESFGERSAILFSMWGNRTGAVMGRGR